MRDLAGDEGFEPPQTESESGVLPLHKSPICRRFQNALSKRKYYYTDKRKNVKINFCIFAKNIYRRVEWKNIH